MFALFFMQHKGMADIRPRFYGIKITTIKKEGGGKKKIYIYTYEVYHSLGLKDSIETL